MATISTQPSITRIDRTDARPPMGSTTNETIVRITTRIAAPIDTPAIGAQAGSEPTARPNSKADNTVHTNSARNATTWTAPAVVRMVVTLPSVGAISANPAIPAAPSRTIASVGRGSTAPHNPAATARSEIPRIAKFRIWTQPVGLSARMLGNGTSVALTRSQPRSRRNDQCTAVRTITTSANVAAPIAPTMPRILASGTPEVYDPAHASRPRAAQPGASRF